MSNWLVIVIPFMLVIVSGAMLAALVSQVLDDALRCRYRKRLRALIHDAVVSSQLPWDKMAILWKDRPLLSQNDVTVVLRSLVADSYTGHDKELKPHEALLEEHLKVSEQLDPLVGLPEDVRLPLERYASEKDSLSDMLPIVNGVRSLVRVHKRESLFWKAISFTSFILSLGSLIFGIYTYYHQK